MTQSNVPLILEYEGMSTWHLYIKESEWNFLSDLWIGGGQVFWYDHYSCDMWESFMFTFTCYFTALFEL